MNECRDGLVGRSVGVLGLELCSLFCGRILDAVVHQFCRVRHCVELLYDDSLNVLIRVVLVDDPIFDVCLNDGGDCA